MTYSATASGDFETHKKALHHEIAKQHFARGARYANHGTVSHFRNLVGHHALTDSANPHMKDMSPEKREHVRNKAAHIVSERSKKIRDESSRKHGQDFGKAKNTASRKHLELGRHHASRAGAKDNIG